MGRGPSPLIHGERFLYETPSLCQGAIGNLHIPLCSKGESRSVLLYALVDTAFAADLRQKVFNAFFPEVEQEAHDTCFAILKSLFPAQDHLYLALLTHFRDVAFPEARWVGNPERCRRGFRLRSPAWVNLCPGELDQCAARLFTDSFVWGEFIDGKQDISCIGVLLFCQRLQKNHLGGFIYISKPGQGSFCLCPAGA